MEFKWAARDHFQLVQWALDKDVNVQSTLQSTTLTFEKIFYFYLYS